MPKINVLDKQVAELIAAGEVVERPASVVKELLENAIDAGSTKIEVEIRSGGKDFIRVSDDGCGIEKEDIKNAFLRHATSKVKTTKDLNGIATLGFRGEALASICAVSKVNIISKTKNSNEGVSYTISSGEEGNLEACGCPNGTSIIVRDLFFNTPARAKFLKKDVSEANAVASLVDKMALSHPEIAFKFIRDGKEVLYTAGDNNIKMCIYSVYGRDFSVNLIPVNFELNNIKVRGYISAPSNARPNRNMQHFFINGRYIKSKTAMVALEQAFKGSLMVGKFPACVLYIDIACEAIDVNIHPSKMEVRFINEKPLFEAVYTCVKQAIMYGNRLKELELSKTKSNEESSKANLEENKKIPLPNSKHMHNIDNEDDKEILEREENTDIKGVELDSFIDEWYLKEEKMLRIKEDEIEDSVESNKKEISIEYTDEEATRINGFFKKERPYNKFIGEVFSTYIVVEHDKDSLMLIDKHAAHEALIYKNLKEKESKIDIQVLISPKNISLEKTEYAVAIQNKTLFKELGFEIEDFGQGNIIVRGIPTIIDIKDTSDCIIEIIQQISENNIEISSSKMNNIYHSIACKAAIKGGSTTDNIELIELASKLQKNPDVNYCPHGRPVSILIKKSEIEKQFGRI